MMVDSAVIIAIVTGILTFAGVLWQTHSAVQSKQVEVTGNAREAVIVQAAQDKIDERQHLYKRIEKLEEIVHKLGLENDSFVLKNAELSAHNTVAQAQIAQLTAQIANYTQTHQENVQLRAELAEARLRIQVLENEMAQMRIRMSGV
jgi:predicted RNase H-like nuclease (RuvC/YqgF family)